MENTLYYGDNLDILRRYIPDNSIDLVYLDPPFKSSQNYNILFKEQNGSRAASHIRAFEDIWTWSQDDEEVFAELVTEGGKVADCLQALRTFLGPCDMLAYLVMMAPRLVELRRVMKPTASCQRIERFRWQGEIGAGFSGREPSALRLVFNPQSRTAPARRQSQTGFRKLIVGDGRLRIVRP